MASPIEDPMMETALTNPWLLGAALNSLLLSVVALLPRKLLTPWGIANAWLLGTIVWGTLGWPGYGVVGFYFLVGSGATRIGMAAKEAAGIAEKRSGARGPENVWGSALTGALCALGTLLVDPDGAGSSLLLLGYVASFSTKLSDTMASEIGKAYGRRTFSPVTLQSVPRGTEGAVSLEGTLAGIAASVAIAVVGWSVGSIDAWGVAICLVAAFVATTAESLIGATLQTQLTWLTNEVVNFINTTIGASVAIVLGFAIGI